jgi:hypothetical protein
MIQVLDGWSMLRIGAAKELTLEVSLSVRMADARLHPNESFATRLADLLELIVDQGFVK